MKSALPRTAPKSTRQWGTRIIRSIARCGLPLSALLFSLPLVAQVQVAKSQTTVTGTTGTMVCSAASVALPTVTLKCVNGSDVFQSSGPVSVGTVAQTITINSTGGAQTWQFTLPTAAGPIAYQVTATPTAGCPSGSVCTGSGTF